MIRNGRVLRKTSRLLSIKDDRLGEELLFYYTLFIAHKELNP